MLCIFFCTSIKKDEQSLLWQVEAGEGWRLLGFSLVFFWLSDILQNINFAFTTTTKRKTHLFFLVCSFYLPHV